MCVGLVLEWNRIFASVKLIYPPSYLMSTIIFGFRCKACKTCTYEQFITDDAHTTYSVVLGSIFCVKIIFLANGNW